MKRMAITYYKDIIRGCSHIKIHESGAEAARYFNANAQNFFQTPIMQKNKNLKLTKNKMLSASIGMRGFYARFLSEKETKIYKQYGEDTWFDTKKAELIKPMED